MYYESTLVQVVQKVVVHKLSSSSDSHTVLNTLWPRVKYGFVTVGGQNVNRVKYRFVTVRDLLLVRRNRGVRGIRILPWPHRRRSNDALNKRPKKSVMQKVPFANESRSHDTGHCSRQKALLNECSYLFWLTIVDISLNIRSQTSNCTTLVDIQQIWMVQILQHFTK
jgi:hypothetical protein